MNAGVDAMALAVVDQSLRKVSYDLYQKAKRFGTWDPQEIDLSTDRAQWDSWTPEQRNQVLALIAGFTLGEESVTLTLAPWLMAIEELEPQMFLSTQLFEEAKHTEFFNRYNDEVLGGMQLTIGPNLKRILVDDLEITAEKMRRCVDLPPEERLVTMAEGFTHYHGIVEGVLAQGGYHAAEVALAAYDYLPGLVKGFRFIRADEGRHITFGMNVLRRLVQNPDCQARVEATFARYMPLVPVVFGPQVLPAAMANYHMRREDIGLPRDPEI